MYVYSLYNNNLTVRTMSIKDNICSNKIRNELKPINFNLLIFKQDYFLNFTYSSVLLSLNPI